MSTLADRLERIKASFLKQAPPEAVAVMDRATNELRDSGITSRLPKPGSPLPEFNLTDTDGQVVNSKELTDKGPLVVTFYRGVW